MTSTVPSRYTSAVTLKAERMLAAAPTVGIDLHEIELVRRRLSVHEIEHWRTRPSPRRVELEAAIAADIDWLCKKFVLLKVAVGGVP